MKEQIHTTLSEPVQSGKMLQPLEHGNGEDVKNISPSHKDCGLDCNQTSQILHCHVNQLSNKIKDLKISMEMSSGNSKRVLEQLCRPSKDAWRGNI